MANPAEGRAAWRRGGEGNPVECGREEGRGSQWAARRAARKGGRRQTRGGAHGVGRGQRHWPGEAATWAEGRRPGEGTAGQGPARGVGMAGTRGASRQGSQKVCGSQESSGVRSYARQSVGAGVKRVWRPAGCTFLRAKSANERMMQDKAAILALGTGRALIQGGYRNLFCMGGNGMTNNQIDLR